MPNQHKTNPIPFRPPANTDDRAWLLRYAKATGRKVNAILTQALQELRERIESEGTNDR